jgi:DNA repair exonuclease SbcCD ATPase subunit
MHRNLLFILILMGFAMTVYAQADQQAQTGDKERKERFLYQWTDDKGVVHITDDRDKVPKAYRDKALKLTQSKTEDEDQGQQVQQKSVAPAGVESEGADSADKAAWQQRMRNAKQRLANAETQYQVLTQRRNELLQSWGGPVSGRIDTRAEADRVEQEMRDVQKEVDAARQELEDIPDQARKAGIPPGWLRE